MIIRRALAASILAAAMFALAPVALAQTDAAGTIMAPAYESGTASAPLSLGQFNTPESDGRPGVKFFAYGAQAFRKGDYRHAVDMLKVSASWAYKPAEYNLGVMYFNGRGVPVDRPLGAAWMILAAEPGNPSGSPAYTRVRDLMVTALTDAQFAETDKLWAKLRETYGDKVALRRARAQWALARSRMTGSRVGGNPGELNVGVADKPTENMAPSNKDASLAGNAEFLAAGFGYLPGGSVSGAVAYRQFRQSNDPYAPIFLKTPRKGKATVGPLEKIERARPTRDPPAPAASSGIPA